MKQVLLKIKAVILAFILLIASNTYAVTSHFCGSVLVDVSYVGATKACGMETSGDDCNSNPKFEKNCCSEITHLVESDLENFTVKSQQNSPNPVFVVSFLTTYINLFSEVEKEYEFPKENSPPDIEQNFQVLYETFLI